MIVNFEPWHLMSVALHCRPEDQEDLSYYALEPDIQRWVCKQSLRPGLLFTVLERSGAPCACFGFNEESATVATAWIMGTKAWTAHVKTIARGVATVMKSGPYLRLQAFIRPDRPRAIRFAEWLGFKLDGRCPKSAPNGQDMLLYSLTREGTP